jgi:DNA-binding beta-propeller fold protein YncE
MIINSAKISITICCFIVLITSAVASDNLRYGIVDSKLKLTVNWRTNELIIQEIKTNKIIKRLSVGKTPISIVTNTKLEKAYVANKDEATISIINLGKLEQTGKINVEGHPSGMMLSKNGDYLFVLNLQVKSIFIIDTTSDAVVETLKFGGISGENGDICYLSENKKIVFMSNVNRWPDKIRRDLDKKITDLAMNPFGEDCYLLDSSNKNVDIVSIRSGEIIGTININNNIDSIYLSQSGDKVFLPHKDSSKGVLVINLHQNVRGKIESSSFDKMKSMAGWFGAIPEPY